MANEQGFPDRYDSSGDIYANNYPIKFSELRDVFSQQSSGSVSISDYYRSTTPLQFGFGNPTIYVEPHNEMVPAANKISLSDFEGSFAGVDVTKVYVYVIKGNSTDLIYLAVNVIGNKSHVMCSGFNFIPDNEWTFDYGSSPFVTTFSISPSDRDFFKGKHEEAHVSDQPIATNGRVTLATGPSSSETFTLIRLNNTNLSVLPSNISTLSTGLHGWEYPWTVTASTPYRPRVAFVDYPTF